MLFNLTHEAHQGKNRTQTCLFTVTLEEFIDDDNEVMIIDAFDNSIKIEDYRFRINFMENGRPAYHLKNFIIPKSTKKLKN